MKQRMTAEDIVRDYRRDMRGRSEMFAVQRRPSEKWERRLYYLCCVAAGYAIGVLVSTF